MTSSDTDGRRAARLGVKGDGDGDGGGDNTAARAWTVVITLTLTQPQLSTLGKNRSLRRDYDSAAKQVADKDIIYDTIPIRTSHRASRSSSVYRLLGKHAQVSRLIVPSLAVRH